MADHDATDRELLLKGDAAAFAVFYDRHAEWVLGFLRRRSPDGEAAADLTAEVFAAALSAPTSSAACASASTDGS
jgi:DNA-directed RNA polymerase specialized sigma24 family protein